MPLEEFGTQREKKDFGSNKKTQFLDLKSTATIRILTNSRLAIFTHYINKATVLCLVDDCPICRNNKNIIMQNSETFREDPSYLPRREVRLVNVLDKTLTRICECGAESRTTAGAVTCKCGKIITGEAKPLNKVKVMSHGVTLFDQLDLINNSVLDTAGEKVGITNYDITLAVSGSGKTKIIAPIPGQITGPVEVDQAELYDLETITIALKEEEMLDLKRGVSLRDIFAARRASEKSVASEAEFISQDKLDVVQESVDSLFGIPS